MRKIVIAIMALSFTMSSLVVADRVRNDSLGQPILNVMDTAVLGRYPAGLQFFPSTIYGLFDFTADYNFFGMGYKASDALALCFTYENNPTPGAQDFYENGALIFTAPTVRAANVIYGGKFGPLLLGASAIVNLYDNQLISTIDYDTNGEANYWGNLNGFMSTFNPSLILDLSGFQLFGTLNTSLNFLEMSTKWSNGDTKANWKPNLLNLIGFSVMAAKEINDTTTLGAEFRWSFVDRGYASKVVNYTTNLYSSSNETYVGGTMNLGFALGSKIKATEAVTFFLDVASSLSSTTPVRAKELPKTLYNVTTVWQIPCVTLGADFAIAKNLNLRISAKPTYSLTTVEPADAKAPFPLAAKSKTVTTSAFDVASGLGLGWAIGPFKINWTLDVNFLDNALLTPMAFANIQGTGPDVATRVQVNYSF